MDTSHQQRMQQHWVSTVIEDHKGARQRSQKLSKRSDTANCTAGSSPAVAQAGSSFPICGMGMRLLPLNGCLEAIWLSTVLKYISSCAWSSTNFLHPDIAALLLLMRPKVKVREKHTSFGRSKPVLPNLILLLCSQLLILNCKFTMVSS